MSMTVVCSLCGENFKQSMAFTHRSGVKPMKCHKCRISSKNLNSVKNLNKDVQNILLSLETRVVRLEENMSIIETIAKTIVEQRLNEFMKDRLSDELVIATQAVEKKYKSEVLILNNRISQLTKEIEELKCEN